MQTTDLTESEIQIIRIIRAFKPKQKLVIWAHESQPGVYYIDESVKRIVFPNKQIFLEVN